MLSMRRYGLRWLGWLLLVVAMALPRAAGSAGAAPGDEPLAGQLLVASPSLGDPRFAHTVISMVAHDGGGAMGLVFNRELGEGSLQALLRSFRPHRSFVEKRLRLVRPARAPLSCYSAVLDRLAAA